MKGANVIVFGALLCGVTLAGVMFSVVSCAEMASLICCNLKVKEIALRSETYVNLDGDKDDFKAVDMHVIKINTIGDHLYAGQSNSVEFSPNKVPI